MQINSPFSPYNAVDFRSPNVPPARSSVVHEKQGIPDSSQQPPSQQPPTTQDTDNVSLKNLTEAEKQLIIALRSRDRQVRWYGETASQGAIQYEYVTGPDGRRYAVARGMPDNSPEAMPGNITLSNNVGQETIDLINQSHQQLTAQSIPDTSVNLTSAKLPSEPPGVTLMKLIQEMNSNGELVRQAAHLDLFA